MINICRLSTGLAILGQWKEVIVLKFIRKPLATNGNVVKKNFFYVAVLFSIFLFWEEIIARIRVNKENHTFER